MLLLLIKYKMPLDEVVFYNTGFEFEAIYKVRDYFINKYLKPLNIKYVELAPKRPFKETMLNYEHMTHKGTIKRGYGWCGGLCRWGTTEKLQSINKYCQDAIQYIGIAYDEPQRYERLTPNKKAPLYDMKITEAEALQICYEAGINFDGLYKILKRVSCWCCRNKNLQELRAYKEHLPQYFKMLCELEEQIGEPMKKPIYLKDRFK